MIISLLNRLTFTHSLDQFGMFSLCIMTGAVARRRGAAGPTATFRFEAIDPIVNIGGGGQPGEESLGQGAYLDRFHGSSQPQVAR